MSITPLSFETVNLIKSSQVITSISSIVKELVENSLDAGATIVSVKLDNFGFGKLEVQDNGNGICEEDVPLSVKPHWTSKISSFSDLCSLSSYGFRGEAISSLCSMSELSITTKVKDCSIGNIYKFNMQREIIRKTPIAVNTGTTLCISNLFKNVPVRRQYYSNPSRRKDELKKVEDIVMAFAIIIPNLHITLYHNKSRIFQKYGVDQVSRAVLSVFQDVSRKLEFKNFSSKEVTIDLWLPAKPNASDISCSRSTSDRLFVYANERSISHKRIEKIVKLFFSSRNEGSHGRYPMGVITINVPKDALDFNLEPNKTKVIFREENSILQYIEELLASIYGGSPLKKGKENEMILPCTLGERTQADKRKESHNADDDFENDAFKVVSRPCKKSKNIQLGENIVSINFEENNILDKNSENSVPSSQIFDKDAIQSRQKALDAYHDNLSKISQNNFLSSTQNDSMSKIQLSSVSDISSIRDAGGIVSGNVRRVLSDVSSTLCSDDTPLLNHVSFAQSSSHSGLSEINNGVNFLNPMPLSDFPALNHDNQSNLLSSVNEICLDINTNDSDNFNFDPILGIANKEDSINRPFSAIDSFDVSETRDTLKSVLNEVAAPDLNGLDSPANGNDWSRGILAVDGRNIQTVELLTSEPAINITQNDSLPLPKNKKFSAPLKNFNLDWKVNTFKKEPLMEVSNLDTSSSSVLKTDSAFSIFARTVRHELLENSPGADFTVVAKEIASRWKNLSKDEMEIYQKKAAAKSAEKREKIGSTISKSGSPSNRRQSNALERMVAPTTPQLGMVPDKLKLKSSSTSNLKPWQQNFLKVDFDISKIVKLKVKKKISSKVANDSSIVGFLANNNWIYYNNRKLHCFNMSCLNEIILFANLMNESRVPAQPLKNPYNFTKSILGQKSWQTLLELRREQTGGSKFVVTEDRINASGLKIVLFISEDNSFEPYGEITHVCDAIPDYGVDDFREILEGILSDSNMTLSSSRSSRLKSWFTKEAIRMSETIRIRGVTSAQEKINSFMKTFSAENMLSKKCLHNKNIFNILWEEIK